MRGGRGAVLAVGDPFVRFLWSTLCLYVCMYACMHACMHACIQYIYIYVYVDMCVYAACSCFGILASFP